MTTTTTMVRSLLFSILLGVWSVCATSLDASTTATMGYAIIPRRELQVTESPALSPVLPSFDGDLSEILRLALAKAADPEDFTLPPSASTPTTPSTVAGLSPTVAPAPTLLVNKPRICGNVDLSTATLLVVSYEYSLETSSADNNANNLEEIAGQAEEALQELMAPTLLKCFNVQAKEAGIVALDSLPRDVPLSNSTCSPSQDDDNNDDSNHNICSVWEGSMRVYIESEAQKDLARDWVLSVIEMVIDGPGFLNSVDLLINAEFIKSKPSPSSTNNNPVPAEEEENAPEDDDDTQPIGSSSLGLNSVLLVSFGAVAIILFVSAAYVWRRSNSDNSSSNDGTTTIQEGESIFIAEGTAAKSVSMVDDDQEQPRPTSPFSQLVPSAYGFSSSMSLVSTEPQQSGMFAIAEDEEQQSTTSDNSSAILMSEAGFSADLVTDTDSSLDLSKSLYTTTKPLEFSSLGLLGARARNPMISSITTTTTIGAAADAGEESDSDLSSEAGGVVYRSATPVPNAATSTTLSALAAAGGGGKLLLATDPESGKHLYAARKQDSSSDDDDDDDDDSEEEDDEELLVFHNW